MQAGPTPDGGFRLEATLPAYVPTAESAAGSRTAGSRTAGAR